MCTGRSKYAAKDGLHSTSQFTVSCELCGKQAARYCQADKAFLCIGCDRTVHTANFLALRHARRILCRTCNRFTRWYVTGASKELKLPPTAVASPRRGTGAETDYSPRTTTRKLPFVFL